MSYLQLAVDALIGLAGVTVGYRGGQAGRTRHLGSSETREGEWQVSDVMKEVWLVEVGQYSDRSTVAACEAEAIADAVAEAMNAGNRPRWSDDYFVSGPVPYFAADDPMPVQVTAWGADLYDDGRIEHRSWEEWSHDLDPRAWQASYYDPAAKATRTLTRAMDYATAEEAEQAAREAAR